MLKILFNLSSSFYIMFVKPNLIEDLWSIVLFLKWLCWWPVSEWSLTLSPSFSSSHTHSTWRPHSGNYLVIIHFFRHLVKFISWLLSLDYYHLTINCLVFRFWLFIIWLSPDCLIITLLSGYHPVIITWLSPGYHQLTCSLSCFQVLVIIIWLSPVCLIITLLSGYHPVIIT